MSGVLFSGYFGLGNCGDEAVLEASVRLLRERRTDLPIAALSADPAGTKRQHGIPAFRRMHPPDLAAAVRGCDLLLSGGGSLLQDRTSSRSLLYYLAVIMLALALRRKVMVFAQGLGPLDRPASRMLTSRVLRRVHRITVRDEDSARLLERLHPDFRPQGAVEVTADPVFALPAVSTQRVTNLLAAEPGSPPQAWIGVSLRPWPGMDAAEEAIAAGLRASDVQPNVLACPFQPSEDLPVCTRLASRLGDGARLVAEPLTPGEYAALLGQMDLVLAARLHALIFAAAAAVPALGIAYDPKVASLQARVGQPDLGPPRDLKAQQVEEAVYKALAGRDAGAADRLETAARLRREAGRTADLALELLDERKH